MRELKRVKVLGERADQFQLYLPKRKVRQICSPSDDNKYYVRVDYEDDFIRITPVEVAARKSSSRTIGKSKGSEEARGTWTEEKDRELGKLLERPGGKEALKKRVKERKTGEKARGTWTEEKDRELGKLLKRLGVEQEKS